MGKWHISIFSHMKFKCSYSLKSACKSNKKKQLTESNHFYNKYFPLYKTAMFDRRVHSHRRNIASNLNAISYRWLTNRSDPSSTRINVGEKKKNVKCE